MNSVEKWGNEWDYYADSEGYEDGYSIFALRWFMLVLFDQESLDEAMEKWGTRAYYRVYYQRNREKRKEMCRLNLIRMAEKLGMTPFELRKKYRDENRNHIKIMMKRNSDRVRERERLKKARGI